MVARGPGSNQWNEHNFVNNSNSRFERIHNSLNNIFFSYPNSTENKVRIKNINREMIASFKALDSVSPDNVSPINSKVLRPTDLNYQFVRAISFGIIGNEVRHSTNSIGYLNTLFKPTEVKVVECNNSEDRVVRISFLFEVHPAKDASTRLLTALYPFQVLPLANSISSTNTTVESSSHQIWHEVKDTTSKMFISLDFKKDQLTNLIKKFKRSNSQNESSVSLAQQYQRIRTFLREHPEELLHKKDNKEANLYNLANKGQLVSPKFFRETLKEIEIKSNEWLSPYSEVGNQIFYDLISYSYVAAGIDNLEKLVAITSDTDLELEDRKLKTTNADQIIVHACAPCLTWNLSGKDGNDKLIEAPYNVTINYGSNTQKTVTTRIFYNMSNYFAQYNFESNVSSVSFDAIFKLITNDSARSKILRSNCLAGAKLREAVVSYLGSTLINENKKAESSISINTDLLSVELSSNSRITKDPQGNFSVLLKLKYDKFPPCLIKMTLDKFTDKIRISNLTLNN